jgi:hypothetical protein
VNLVVPPNLLESLIAWPATHGDFPTVLDNVDEASCFNAGFLLVNGLQRLSKFLAEEDRDLAPLIEDGIRCDGAVVGLGYYGCLELFNVAAGLEMALARGQHGVVSRR